MRKNCNLELQLIPSAYYGGKIGDESSSGYSDSDQSQQGRTTVLMEESASNGISPKQSQPLTIFYNGKVCVCDVNEIQVRVHSSSFFLNIFIYLNYRSLLIFNCSFMQAKAILLTAKREADERSARTPTPATANLRSPVYTPTPSLSMKKSLQRFLQKRQHRAQAMTPYNR